MAEPLRESFDASKRYRNVIWIADRDGQDFSLNEMENILDLERERFGRRVFKDGGIPDGLDVQVLGGGQIAIAEGSVWLLGRMEPIAGATLSYDPAKVTGADTVYARWLFDQVTVSEDPTLVSVFNGDAVEERGRVTVDLALVSPEALDERFEQWSGTVPVNWTLATGGSAKGYPAKFGETSVKLIHTNGVETRLEHDITLTPSTSYTLQFWVRTEDGETDLSLINGAFADLQRTSPAWNPQDYPFATSSTRFTRQTYPFTSDANTQTAQIRFVIPAGAPSTEILIDAVLVTTTPLTALQLARHYIPLLFWDRATDVITKAVPRASNIKMSDLLPPLEGTDIINIERNLGLLRENATTVYDENGHYRVPPGLDISRDTSNDAGGNLGLRVAPGRGYVNGYRVTLPVSTRLQVPRATTTLVRLDETIPYTPGTNLYGLGKSFEARAFPTKQINAVTTQVVQNVQITRGSGSTDALTGASNVVDILGVYRGTVNGTHTGTGASYPITFTEANNVLKLQTTKWDNSGLDTQQTLTFARGSYTLAEIVEALQRQSGRAYRSGRVPSNIEFFTSGGQLGIRTLTQAASPSSGQQLKIETTGNGSTADTPLGLTAGTYTGTGTYYLKTTDWLKGAGDTIDWSPGGAEPTLAQSYNVVLYKTVNLIANTDYKLGGLFASPATYHYRVAAWGPDGEGVAATAVSIVTPAGGINQLTWSRSSGAISYHVYRSADGGSTYGLLRNVVDPGAGVTVTMQDAGSQTPDGAKTPVTSAPTTLDGALSAGATSITVGSTAGWPNATGTGFINGTDDFTFTSKSGGSNTIFGGVPASGAGSVVAHNSGDAVTLGPGVFGLAAAAYNPGVLNLTPLGSVDFAATRGEPMADLTVSTSMLVDYEYYLPRVDRVVIDRSALVSAIPGVPAEDPLPAPKLDEVMELGQVYVKAGTVLEPTIVNSQANNRPTIVDLRAALVRLEGLAQNDANQAIINQINGNDTGVKKGTFADALASDLYVDHAFNRNSVATSCFVDLLYQTVSIGRVIGINAMSDETLTRNAGASTAVLQGTRDVLPSSEQTLITQDQWSDVIPVNPYAVFDPPTPRIWLTPNRNVWNANIATGGGLARAWADMLGRLPSLSTPASWPSWRGLWQTALSELRRLQSAGDVMALTPVLIRIDGEHYGYDSVEDNIRILFANTEVDATPISPTVAGTIAGTLKSDTGGRFSATIVSPVTSASWPNNVIPTNVAFDVEAKGPVRTARAAFNGSLSINVYERFDPLAQTISFAADKTLSAVGVWFTAKPTAVATGPTVTMQIRNTVNGFPGPDVLASVEIQPSAITLNAETKFSLRDYLYLPAGTEVAICLLSESNLYKVQIATLGHMGQNPVAWVSSNPYTNGVLFTSANNTAWTPEQASDLRFKVYGRTFTTPAILEFTEIAADITTAWLGVDQIVPPGTTVRWEYEISGASSVQYPIEPFNPRDITPTEATSFLLRARLATTNPDISPMILRDSVGVVRARNDLAGSYVSVASIFTQDLVAGNVYAYVSLPSGATITAYLSNDDGLTWTNAGTPTVTAVDQVWSLYSYAAPNFTVSSGNRILRVYFALTAPNRVDMPRIARIGATVR